MLDVSLPFLIPYCRTHQSEAETLLFTDIIASIPACFHLSCIIAGFQWHGMFIFRRTEKVHIIVFGRVSVLDRLLNMFPFTGETAPDAAIGT